MPWPDDAFSNFLREKIEENKGKKVKGKKWSFTRKGHGNTITLGETYYIPGTYGYIPSEEVPTYAQPQEKKTIPLKYQGAIQQEIEGETPFTPLHQGAPPMSTPVPEGFSPISTPVPEGFSPISTPATNEFVASYPNYKDRLLEWRNTYYYAQFDENNQFIPGVTFPNPNGESLDKYPGALGWDANGDPFYGSGIKGFWNRIVNQITSPYGKEEAARRNRATYKPHATYVGGAGEAFQTTVKEMLNALSVPAQWTEQVLGVPLAIADYGQKEYVAPGAEPGSILETWEKIMKGVVLQQAEERGRSYHLGLKTDELKRFWHNLVENSDELMRRSYYTSIHAITRNLVRALKTKTPAELANDVEEGWQSGKILYTTIIDPLVRDEFVRRWKAGENPDLLKIELQNPWAEMAGQMVLDPLNYIGPGLLKPSRDSRRIAKAARRLDVAPEIEKLLQGSRLTSAAELSDAKIAENLEKLVVAVADDFTKHAAKRSAWAENYAFWELTATGKRNAIAQNMGELFARLAADHADDANVVDEFLSLYQIAKGSLTNNPDLVATGLTGAAKMPNIRYALGEDGKDIGLMLYHLLGDDPKKFFPTMKKYADKGLPELIEWLSGKMDEALVKAFPTVNQRIARGEKVPWALRAFNSFNNAAQKFYRPLNSFFAGVYMSSSPGYFVRNVLNNSFTMAVDEGLSALAKDPDVLLDDLKDMLGGVIPRGVGGFSRGVQGVETAAELEGKVAEKMGGVGKFLKKWNFANLSNQAEYKASAQVVYKAVKRTMDRLVAPGRALPPVDDLVSAGMDRKTAETLYDLVVRHRYNVDSAVKEFIDKNKSGSIWALDNLGFLSNKEKKIIREYEFDNLVLDALKSTKEKGGTAEEAMAIIQKKIDEMIQTAETALKNAPAVVDEDAEGVELYTALMGAKASGVKIGYLSEAAHYTQANSNVLKVFRDALGANYSDDIERKLGSLYATQRIRAQHANDIADQVGLADFDYDINWKQLGLPGEAPKDPKIFKERMWREYYFEPMRKAWEELRDEAVKYALDQFNASGGMLNPVKFAEAKKHYQLALEWDKVMRRDEVRLGLWASINSGDAASAARIYGEQFGIPPTEGSHLLNAINKYLPEGKEKYASLREIPLEDLRPGGEVYQALARRLRAKVGLEAEVAEEAAKIAPEVVETATEAVEALGAAQAATPVPPAASNAPSVARMFYEQRDGLQDFISNVLYNRIRDNWDTYYPTLNNRQLTNALEAWRKMANKGVSEARYIAQLVGDEARNFTLLDYNGKRYFDLALAYIFPYHFWYNRTYAHWMMRLAQSPEVLAAYAKYKDGMAKAHAGAPEWWRYNISSNELLGIDSDNPLYFNLEATLFPLYGLTGVDFNDPLKRIDWWAATVDDMSKLGPSTWTPISIAMALSLQAQGEEETAQRWGGRLIPQTAALKSVLSLMNINVKTGKGINEFDPMVLLFSNGMDPYERRRVGRALALMVEQGVASMKEAITAAHKQEGELWDQAVELAQESRAFGQLSSTLFGVGFKARSETDMQIDMFDQDWRILWAQAPDMTPEEVRIAMDELRDKYPFGDLVILSRKSGLDRDRSLAYNVLGRIPPGQKLDIAELVGVNPALMDKFYADKGRMDKWPQADYMEFMAGMLNIGAILDLPDSATRAKWTEARNRYEQLNRDLEKKYGVDILSKIDAFYEMRKNDQDAAYAWLDENPEVQAAMDEKEKRLIFDSAMAPYYASIDKIENYYRSRMWDAMRASIPDLDRHLTAWRNLKYIDQKAANKYWDEHLGKKYSELKDIYSKQASEAIVRVSKALQSPDYPGIVVSEEAGAGAQDLLQELGGETRTTYQYTWKDWKEMLNNPILTRLVEDSFHGRKLSYNARNELEYLADTMDMDVDVMLQLMEQSYYGGQ